MLCSQLNIGSEGGDPPQVLKILFNLIDEQGLSPLSFRFKPNAIFIG